MSDTSEAATQQGPVGYENWKAALLGAPCLGKSEASLYTDAEITGHLPSEIWEAPCPYSFLNAMALGRHHAQLAPAVVLRLQYHLDDGPTKSMEVTDTARYHGGDLIDEVAALASLAMGVRFRAGGTTRYFWDDDPAGRPQADLSIPTSPLLSPMRVARVPHARGSHQLNAPLLRYFARYPKLAPNDAVTLVRASRLYRDGLWVVESEPELAWLFFVSALEAAATPFQTQTSDAVEVLRSSHGPLVRLLEDRGGPELVEQVAQHLHRLLKAGARFRGFVLRHLPDPPSGDRPHENVRVSWEPSDMKRSLDIIYSHRSRALHDGTPFPPLMSIPPAFPNWERDPALAASMKGGTWTKDDMPMLIHVFEHITRGVLLKWWEEAGKGDRLAAPA